MPVELSQLAHKALSVAILAISATLFMYYLIFVFVNVFKGRSNAKKRRIDN